MASLTNIPRAVDGPAFDADPLRYLRSARANHGDVFLVRADGPLFSRSRDCPGVVAVFGESNVAQALDEKCGYGLPVSAARQFELPPELININRSLHSMSSSEHRSQKAALSAHMSPLSAEERDRIAAMVTANLDALETDNPFDLTARLKSLMVEIAGELFFGSGAVPDGFALAMSAYFQLRRSASSRFAETDVSREQLVQLGLSIDRSLRGAIRSARRTDPGAPKSLLGKLAAQTIDGEYSYSEDQIVGHLNVLFISATEPVTMTLVWTMLALSQNPHSMQSLNVAARSPDSVAFERALRPILMEVLRLLTPNAIMTRVALQDTSLGAFEIPRNTEILICPLLIHRDAAVFSNPQHFLPERWTTTKPSRSQYLPFGTGTHVCLGQSVAHSLLSCVLKNILQGDRRFVLAPDQKIDWQINIMLCPAKELLFVPTESCTHSPKVIGTIGELLGRSDVEI